MPMTVKPLPQEFYDTIDTLSFQEIAYRVADAFFGEDVPADTLKQIVYDTLSFDVPLVKVADNIYSLELFHGPTLAFKDVGGRFMARLLAKFEKRDALSGPRLSSQAENCAAGSQPIKSGVVEKKSVLTDFDIRIISVWKLYGAVLYTGKAGAGAATGSRQAYLAGVGFSYAESADYRDRGYAGDLSQTSEALPGV